MATPELIELVLRALLLRQGHLPVGFRGVALLLGDEILSRQRIVALCIQARAGLIRFRTIDVGLRRGDIFLAISALALLVLGPGSLGRPASLGDFFLALAVLGLLRRGAGLLQRGQKLAVLEGDQDLAWLHGIALANKDFIDAPGDLRSHANVSRFHRTRTLQRGIVPEPASRKHRPGHDRGEGQSYKENALRAHDPVHPLWLRFWRRWRWGLTRRQAQPQYVQRGVNALGQGCVAVDRPQQQGTERRL